MKRSDHIFLQANILAVLFVIAALIPNFWLNLTESMGWAASFANLLLPGGLYCLLVVAWRRLVGRMVVVMLPVMVLAAFQIVLLFLYGESIIAIDMFMNVFTTNSREVSELLGNLLPAIFTVVVVYLPLLIWAVVLWVKHRRASLRFAKRIRIVGWTAVATGALLCVVASAIGRFNVFEHIFPANVVHNFYTSLVRVNQIEHYQSTSEGWSAHGRRARHNTSGSHELYVLVVGETSRAENWQLLGYSRDTNPKLSTLSGLTVFPEAYTCSNTTHKSVPMMLSSLTPYDFDSINYRKGMLATFGEAGFRTAFISNQSRNRSYIDFFGEQADTTIFLHDDSRPHYDTDLLTHTADLMTKGLSQGDMLLVVHTYGSHFNYRDRYPRSQAHFLPDAFPAATLAHKEQLVNAYDNTIRFTDKFLYDLINQIDSLQIPAVVIYASDHGEDLYDDSRHRFLHASPRPTQWQLHVPMLVWTSEDYRKAYPDKVETLRSNSGKRVSPSTSVYHTILDMSGVMTDDYDPTLSLTSISYQPHRPVYLTDRNTPESDIR